MGNETIGAHDRSGGVVQALVSRSLDSIAIDMYVKGSREREINDWSLVPPRFVPKKVVRGVAWYLSRAVDGGSILNSEVDRKNKWRLKRKNQEPWFRVKAGADFRDKVGVKFVASMVGVSDVPLTKGRVFIKQLEMFNNGKCNYEDWLMVLTPVGFRKGSMAEHWAAEGSFDQMTEISLGKVSVVEPSYFLFSTEYLNDPLRAEMEIAKSEGNFLWP